MITVKNVNKHFDDFHALKDLSINVNTGSIYGLVGTNGSGKTTIIKHLTGILRQDSGEILFDGEPVYENPVWDQERYDEMRKAFDLGSGKKMNSFSKGMQKQAAFILTMCTRPKYLILDEPIDGLDPIIRKLVWKYIIDDVSEGMTVLISSHNLREMEGICDSIGILDKGRMHIERDLDELKSDINKIQVAFNDKADAEKGYAGLNIVHRESRGKVDLLIIRNDSEQIRRALEPYRPILFDVLPLTLEEIFIYELGGEHYEIKDIIL